MIARSKPAEKDRAIQEWQPTLFQKTVVTAFIAFHLVAIICWCAPINSLLVTNFNQVTRPYMLWSGLFQSWNMFTPDPLKLNVYVEAEVRFHDGGKRIWGFPRMDKLGLLDRYSKERYRKFANDYLRMDANSALWPDAARYVARDAARAMADPSNPPVMVQLVRYWSQIMPPGPDGSYRSEPWTEYRFFTYIVRSGDLE